MNAPTHSHNAAWRSEPSVLERLWVPLVLIAAGAAIAAVVTAFQTTRYDATTRIGISAAPTDLDAELDVVRGVIEAEAPVGADVRLSAAADDGTISLTVRADTPEQAQRVSGQLADAYVGSAGAAARIVTAAPLPDDPATPNRFRTIGIGGLVGALAGAGVLGWLGRRRPVEATGADAPVQHARPREPERVKGHAFADAVTEPRPELGEPTPQEDAQQSNVRQMVDVVMPSIVDDADAGVAEVSTTEAAPEAGEVPTVEAASTTGEVPATGDVPTVEAAPTTESPPATGEVPGAEGTPEMSDPGPAPVGDTDLSPEADSPTSATARAGAFGPDPTPADDGEPDSESPSDPTLGATELPVRFAEHAAAARIDDLESQIGFLQSEVRRYTELLQSERITHSRRLAEQRLAADAGADDIHRQHQNAVELLRRQHREALAERQIEFDKALADANTKNANLVEAEHRRHEADLERERARRRSEADAAQQRLAELRDQNERLEADAASAAPASTDHEELTSLRAEVGELRSRLQETDAAMRAASTQLEAAQRRAATAQQRHEQQIKELEAKVEDAQHRVEHERRRSAATLAEVLERSAGLAAEADEARRRHLVQLEAAQLRDQESSEQLRALIAATEERARATAAREAELEALIATLRSGGSAID